MPDDVKKWKQTQNTYCHSIDSNLKLMATTTTNSHGGKHRPDPDIEKYRLELNWTKILDKLKTAKVSEYAKFLEGEAQLELYLQQYPLTDSNHIVHARQVLLRVENLLKTGESSRSFEGQCLLAKLYYAQGRYEDCLVNVNLALNSIPNDIKEQPHRSSLLLAETYTLKGLLLEKNNENLLEVIKAFDDSCKLSKTYYTAVEKAKHLSNDNLDIENSLIELAYQRLPLLHASNNNLTTAIEIFRSYIQNVHIKSLETMRQTLIKQYAQLLIKCVCKGNYPPLTASHDVDHHHHQRRNSQPLFVPRDVDEEILLLLLLGQTSALNEAVLDWQPEYEAQRERSHQAAYNILALLSIFLSRKQAFHIIADSYEQALRFSFEHFQTWYNYGLALISSGQPFRAYLILKECLRMQPQNIQVYLQLTKIILEYIYDLPSLFETFPSSGEDAQPLLKQTSNQQQNNLNQHEQRPPFIDLIDEAIGYCEQAKELENGRFPRALLLLALAKSFKARQTSIHNDRQALFQSAVHELRECIQLDPYDSIAHFHLAHNLSFLNETGEAFKSIETCLLLSPDDKFALHLYTLLLTAQKQMPEAYAQIYRATNDYPDISLLLTKASIEEELYGCEQSIVTCKEALLLWKNEFEPILMNNINHARGVSHSSGGNRPGGRSQNPSIHTEIDGEQTLNVQQGTLKVEDGIKNLFLSGLRPLSGLLSDENSIGNNRSSTSFFSVQPIYFSLFQIFEHLVRYYIKLDKIDESERCIKEVSSLSPLCHQMFYMRGLVNDARGQLKIAKQNYNDALAINPYHFPTLIQLTKLLIQIGNYSLAEKYARDAISIQPSNYQPWYLLSLSMEARGEYEQSVDVGATAVHLEGDSPIVSYYSIMRVL